MRACNKQRSKIPLGTKGRTSILSYREYVRPAELHSQSAEENCPTENSSSLCSVKGATLPYDAYPEYRKARNEMQELVRAQKNVERFFAEEKPAQENEQVR